MELQEAKGLAEKLVRAMAPYCERIEIAGSIRRSKSEVGDIEIVAIPKYGTMKRGMFEDEEPVNLLHSWALRVKQVEWIKTGSSKIEPWTPKADGKHWKAILPQGIKLDLFLCTPKNWGYIFLLRTGSAEFSHAIVTHAKKIGRPGVEGFLTIAGVPVETPEERDAFKLLGLEYTEPHERRSGAWIRKVVAR